MAWFQEGCPLGERWVAMVCDVPQVSQVFTPEKEIGHEASE